MTQKLAERFVITSALNASGSESMAKRMKFSMINTKIFKNPIVVQAKFVWLYVFIRSGQNIAIIVLLQKIRIVHY